MMPLSEYEQRVLEELERDLGADPKLGQAMSRTPRSRGKLTWSVLGVLVGLGIVLAGAVSQLPVLGIAGFALMIAAGLWALMSPRSVATPHVKGEPKSGPGSKAAKQEDQNFMRRVEERFERRREQGDL